jgi:uncharacterized protein YceH (UPF0502 family)
MLDRTERRILGVLLEKELSVPDSYPLTANALLAGCNQKSNREPEMSLELFEVDGALLAMQLKGWVVKTESSRAPRYRHKIDERLALDGREKAVLAELLLRGPQAAGALKTRVPRMGFEAASPTDVEAVLLALRDRPEPLVRLLPRAPRERDARWQHCLAPADELAGKDDAAATSEAEEPGARPIPRRDAGLEERFGRIEQELAGLRRELNDLRARMEGNAGQAFSDS